MKEKIEELAKVKIKNGFLKFLEKTLEYFNIKNIEELNEENSFEIIDFLHKSRTKSNKSYWILYTNFSEQEYNLKIKVYKAKESLLAKNNIYKYPGKKRSEIIKKQNDNFHGFGYSGWFVKNDMKYYLRSKKEFIFLNYLIKTKPNSNFKMECEIYEYENYTYKPDIFEFDIENKLICIYEVKYKKEDFNNDKYIKFEEYAKNVLNIPYIKLFDINKISKQYPEIIVEFENWKNQLISENSKNNFSRNNPMLGVKQKESTKRLIGEKAKKRFEDDNYKENIRIKTKEFFANKETDSYKKWHQSIITSSSKAKNERLEKLNLEKPLITKTCIICGENFETRDVDKKTCTKNGCALKYKIKFEGFVRKKASKESLFKSYIGKIYSNIDKIIFDENTDYDTYVKNVFIKKEEGVIPEKFGMTTHNVLEKYFGGFEDMKKSYLNYKRGNNDIKN